MHGFSWSWIDLKNKVKYRGAVNGGKTKETTTAIQRHTIHHYMGCTERFASTGCMCSAARKSFSHTRPNERRECRSVALPVFASHACNGLSFLQTPVACGLRADDYDYWVVHIILKDPWRCLCSPWPLLVPLPIPATPRFSCAHTNFKLSYLAASSRTRRCPFRAAQEYVRSFKVTPLSLAPCRT